VPICNLIIFIVQYLSSKEPDYEEFFYKNRDSLDKALSNINCKKENQQDFIKKINSIDKSFFHKNLNKKDIFIYILIAIEEYCEENKD
jgi:hypothetical protein